MKFKSDCIVAIVPARKGSKRLPGKNMMPLAGRPLIDWTIKAALQSNVFTSIIVSSDDPQIISNTEEWCVSGVLRPAGLASDTATTTDAILHALDFLNKTIVDPAAFMLLQPTSPLRTAVDICNAVDVMVKKGSDNVVSICRAEHPPSWCGTIDEDGKMTNFLRSNDVNLRSQDLSDYYRLNGAIYLAKTEVFRSRKSFFTENCRPYVMPVSRSVDIDTKLDFQIADLLLRHQPSSFADIDDT
jgi:CMP-N-acetylneuraminic acid synthetase